MTGNVDYLLIGGGLASAYNAEILRKEGAIGRIVILSAENFLPYYRSQLPRAYLQRKVTAEQLLIFTPDYYEKNNIEIMLNTKALSIQPAEKMVTTDTLGDMHYHKLLIATGCSPEKVPLPCDHLTGIFYLKTLEDAQAIMPHMPKAKHVVIGGGNFIGIELASLFIKQGMKVSLITDEFHLFNVSPSTEIGNFLRNHGVEVFLSETIQQFHGKKRVQSVETSTGKTITCDFVVLTGNYLPETGFLENSGIALNDGILVDQYLQTSQEDIYAAGDVTKFYDPLSDQFRRNGGTDNAIKQGKIAALNMLGLRKSYKSTSYFHMQAFDNAIVILGDTTDTEELIMRGSILEKNAAFFYLKEGLLQGAFFSGRPIEEIRAAESIILNRINLNPHKKKLEDLAFSLEVIATQIIFALQGGGAFGAFECGVVRAMEEQQIYPDIVSGISIGAFNAAIIASNPKNATAALNSFWDDLALNLFSNPDEQMRRLLSSWHAIVWGSPNFFYPRWSQPIFSLDQLPLNWTSFYDNSLIKNLLHKYVDFKKLKTSPIRLLVMAVNVETAELETFDSYTEEITVDHIIASGSLPPGFPWTTINNKHYWDGGIVSNTPIDSTLEICGSTNKKIYIVELYSRNRALPQNMIEVLTRKDEIFFSEKIRKDMQTKDLITSYKELIRRILNFSDPALVEEVKQLPAYIQIMGEPGGLAITRIIREIKKGEPYSWDSDFSKETIEQFKLSGYEIAKKTLDLRKNER